MVKPEGIRGLNENGDPQLTVVGPWLGNYSALVEQGEYRDLVLNQSLGFTGRDVGFLRSLPGLERLELSGVMTGVRAVESCTALVDLNLNVSGDEEVDFTALSNLKSVFVYGLGKSRSVLECSSLENLYCYNFPDRDCFAMSNLVRLRRLQLAPARKLDTVDGIEALSKLEMLSIAMASRLQDMSAICKVPGLKELELENCRRLGEISFVECLPGLRKLFVNSCGRIASLKPLLACKELEVFLAWESTNVVDGDLAILGELPKLQKVAIQQRRHYSGLPQGFSN